MNFEVLTHSSILLDDCIYIDPYLIKEEKHNAKVIFITHSHYDHFSWEDIEKIQNKNTWFVAPLDVASELLKKGLENRLVAVAPNCKYVVCNIPFETFGAYNIDKKFHPQNNKWVGYNILLDNKKYAILGDTDENEDNRKIKCDVLFIPIGGTYTMDAKQAAILANKIEPEIAVPTHYACIVGTKEDADIFKEHLSDKIECKTFI